MAQLENRAPGLYWQSRMGNNVDGIGGNCHRYDVVTADSVGKAKQAHFIVDYGVKLGAHRDGYEFEFPSPKDLFAKRGSDRLEGGGEPPEALLLTHAHEDHLGAIRHAIEMGYQIPPVHTTAFTAQILAKSLLNGGIEKELRPPVKIVEPGEIVRVAHAEVEFLAVDHLPGASALRIATPEATIVHTGDYKFDHTLPLGHRADPARLKAIGDQGVDLVVADSTAVSETGEKVYERDIQRNLSQIIADNAGRPIVAGVLGTQLDRLASLGKAAAENGRVLVLTGRSLENNVVALSRSGTNIKSVTGTRVLRAIDAQDVPADKALVVTTGAFAQPMAGLTRAADRAPGALWIDQDSTVIIPQRAIPPVRSAYNAMVGKLENRGARVITAENVEKFGYGSIHQSGHAIASDTKLLYSLLKPRQSVAPMHGGPKQLEANANIARSLGVYAIPIPHNGAILQVTHQSVRVVGEADTARIGAAATHQNKQVARAKKGEDRRDGPVPVYRYDELKHDGQGAAHSGNTRARAAPRQAAGR